MGNVMEYENRDERCRYPFFPGPAGYCWSYAFFVDEGEAWLKKRGVEKMEDICQKCELWKAGILEGDATPT
jgi:hypothetical protein